MHRSLRSASLLLLLLLLLLISSCYSQRLTRWTRPEVEVVGHVPPGGLGGFPFSALWASRGLETTEGDVPLFLRIKNLDHHDDGLYFVEVPLDPGAAAEGADDSEPPPPSPLTFWAELPTWRDRRSYGWSEAPGPLPSLVDEHGRPKPGEDDGPLAVCVARTEGRYYELRLFARDGDDWVQRQVIPIGRGHQSSLRAALAVPFYLVTFPLDVATAIPQCCCLTPIAPL